jgi:hypothetical protein
MVGFHDLLGEKHKSGNYQIQKCTVSPRGHVVAWLRHYATSRTVTGSIVDEIIGFFN